MIGKTTRAERDSKGHGVSINLAALPRSKRTISLKRTAAVGSPVFETFRIPRLGVVDQPRLARPVRCSVRDAAVRIFAHLDTRLDVVRSGRAVQELGVVVGDGVVAGHDDDLVAQLCG
jgi:hypothetical protein